MSSLTEGCVEETEIVKTVKVRSLTLSISNAAGGKKIINIVNKHLLYSKVRFLYKRSIDRIKRSRQGKSLMATNFVRIESGMPV